MSVITMVTDPATDKQIPKAKGIIKRINIKQINADGSPRITNINKGPNAGKTIKATHRYSILLEVGEDAVWLSFGEGEVKNPKYADQFQIKVGDQYKNLLPGMEISVYPVQENKWMKDGVEQTSWQAKKKNINLLDESGAQQPTQQQSSGGAAIPAGGTKIFGEVISIDNGVAQVKTENGLVGPVVLGSNTVTVGGRLAAIVDASGNILSGFKAYGPAGQGGGASGGKSAGSFKKDNSGVETGHAINGALNLKRNGHKLEVLDLAKIVHDTTVALKASERARDENKGVSDYDIGAAVGHAVLNATRDVKPQDGLAEALTTYAQGLLSRVVPEITAYVKAGGAEGIKAAEAEAAAKAKAEQESAAAAAQQASQPVQQPVQQQQSIDMSPPPMDFDDDIPFAPVGLQYARHAIFAI
ncbi:hypothetical protein KASHIRA_00380 [Serratia phage vB_SmaM-Kashira]|nr:hypothetical protein KASHIRA_00380 [Serratia phage vB_SmaM-Kashira]